MRLLAICALMIAAAHSQEICHVEHPTATLTIHYAAGAPALDTDPQSAIWKNAATAEIVRDCSRVLDYPRLRTEVRGFWTDTSLYLLFACPYRQLNVFLPAKNGADRDKLWDRDVVEMFLGSDWNDIKRYREFEMAPTGDWVDLDIDYGHDHYDESWNSGWTVKARIDESTHTWYAAARIPLDAVSAMPVRAGTRWRANLYRIEGLGADPQRHFLCWQPTCVQNRDPNHVPENFGTLVFAK